MFIYNPTSVAPPSVNPPNSLPQPVMMTANYMYASVPPQQQQQLQPSYVLVAASSIPPMYLPQQLQLPQPQPQPHPQSQPQSQSQTQPQQQVPSGCLYKTAPATFPQPQCYVPGPPPTAPLPFPTPSSNNNSSIPILPITANVDVPHLNTATLSGTTATTTTTVVPVSVGATQSPRNPEQRIQVVVGKSLSSLNGVGSTKNATAQSPATASPRRGDNGAAYHIGTLYQGRVKRYNPQHGFGFLTATHELRPIDLEQLGLSSDSASDTDTKPSDPSAGAPAAAAAATPEKPKKVIDVSSADIVQIDGKYYERVESAAGDIFVHHHKLLVPTVFEDNEDVLGSVSALSGPVPPPAEHNSAANSSTGDDSSSSAAPKAWTPPSAASEENLRRFFRIFTAGAAVRFQCDLYTTGDKHQAVNVELLPRQGTLLITPEERAQMLAAATAAATRLKLVDRREVSTSGFSMSLAYANTPLPPYPLPILGSANAPAATPVTVRVGASSQQQQKYNRSNSTSHVSASAAPAVPTVDVAAHTPVAACRYNAINMFHFPIGDDLHSQANLADAADGEGGRIADGTAVEDDNQSNSSFSLSTYDFAFTIEEEEDEEKEAIGAGRCRHHAHTHTHTHHEGPRTIPLAFAAVGAKGAGDAMVVTPVSMGDTLLSANTMLKEERSIQSLRL